VETVVDTRPKASSGTSSSGHPVALPDVRTDGFQRLRLSMDEFNRVLGGGIVPGSVVLIGGDPGIGKSTLLLQAASQVASNGGNALYVSGEESVHQIKMRSDRLGISPSTLYLLGETNLESLVEHIRQLSPKMVVVDSIQTIYTEELTSAAGSVGQVRQCTARLLELAKAYGIPVFIVGHVTKAGSIAGPRVLEHIVDTVLYLEGERFHSYRLLRGVKNRFGSTNEVGVFEMSDEGMIEVSNPSQALLSERPQAVAGSAVAATLEGTRPLLVEIQALTSITSFGLPRRTANGIDFNRLLLLVAVLAKRVGLNLSNQDVFVNVVGGLKISEPAADLAVATSIASSFWDALIPQDLALFGEVGLSGELRSVHQAELRLREAAKLGFKRCLIPRAVSRIRGIRDIDVEVLRAGSIPEALDVALGGIKGRKGVVGKDSRRQNGEKP
jgi:DNA repair protein RadA/Sms